MTPPLSDAAEILKLIENVDPDNKDSLDKIDARVWAFLKLIGPDFKISFNDCTVYYRHNSWPKDAQTVLHHSFQHPQYSRSRDALKSIRPEGWWFSIHQYGKRHNCVANWSGNPDDVYMTTPTLTETLAELHAIIQSIAHERTQQ